MAAIIRNFDISSSTEVMFLDIKKIKSDRSASGINFGLLLFNMYIMDMPELEFSKSLNALTMQPLHNMNQRLICIQLQADIKDWKNKIKQWKLFLRKWRR